MQLLSESGASTTGRPRYGSVAFWVFGSTIYEVQTRHLHQILAFPERFALNDETIDAVLAQTGEKRGIEGEARGILIAMAARNGWMRVRHYVGRDDYWSLQVDEIGVRARTVDAFVAWALATGYMHSDDEIRITDERERLSYSAHQLLDAPLTRTGDF